MILPDWIIYFVLYDIWVLSIGLCCVMIVFYYGVCNNIYLRDNKILRTKDYTLFFVMYITGFFLTPLVSQPNVVWNSTKDFLLYNPLRLQFHFGITYYVVISLLVGLTVLIWFYLIIIFIYNIKAWYYKNPQYIKILEWVLYSNHIDNSDWCINVSQTDEEWVPASLTSPTEDFTNLDFKIPTGYIYKPIFKNNKLIKLSYYWIGSKTKNIFFLWYFFLIFYSLLLWYLYYIITWCALLFFSFFILYFSFFLYFWAISYTFKKKIVEKNKNAVSLFLLFIFMVFFFIYFYQDLLYLCSL